MAVRAESIDAATWNTLTAVTELTLHSHAVATVFDLLGGKEDDITYSVGWGLAQSEGFTRSVLREAYGDAEQGEITAIRLQESESGTGRTDVEIETERLHLIVEAKRGRNLPPPLPAPAVCRSPQRARGARRPHRCSRRVRAVLPARAGPPEVDR